MVPSEHRFVDYSNNLPVGVREQKETVFQSTCWHPPPRDLKKRINVANTKLY